MKYETTLYSRISSIGGDYYIGHEKFQYQADMNFGLVIILASILFVIIKMFNLGRI